MSTGAVLFDPAIYLFAGIAVWWVIFFECRSAERPKGVSPPVGSEILNRRGTWGHAGAEDRRKRAVLPPGSRAQRVAKNAIISLHEI